MTEYKFYDIPALVREKDRLSTSGEAEKWQIIDYETADFSGRLLFADENSSPKSLTLQIGVVGKYRIYLGMINPRGETSTGFCVSSSGKKTQFRTLLRQNECWKSLEWFEESYYATLDLTGESFVLSKPAMKGINSSLAWIRLVSENNSEEREFDPCMAYHFDLDYFNDDNYNEIQEPLGRMRMVKDGAPELILQEKPPLYDLAAARAKGLEIKWGKYYLENFEDLDRALVAEAHSMGAKIYAAYRIQAGGFGYFANHLNNTYEDEWFEEHPEYRCITRDGRVIATSSFAYPEVRRRVVEMIVNGTADYDGVCVFHHRGTVIAFEEPVKKMVLERYGVDATYLPMTDPRLHDVMCHFVTLFMRELREALDDKKEINVIVYHSPEKSKHFGYDVKTWIDEGLVDSISQGLMTHFENLDGLLDDDGLIDMGKYKTALAERPVMCRVYSPDYALVTEGAREFLKICEGKVDFYATLAWEGTDIKRVLPLIDGLKSLGVKKFFSWDTNHKSKILPRLNAEKFYAAGDADIYKVKGSRYIRTMSIAGDDISTYNIDWKG